MRIRAVLLVVAILLVAAFAALNWGEFVRSTPLSFGVFVMDAPLGVILLGLLALSVIAFALAAGAIRTQALFEYREHHKSLEHQRALADKAEASRFTDLRTHLDEQLRELRERDAVAASGFEKAMVQSQRDLRMQLEQFNRTLAARLNELETRIDARLAAGAVAPAAHPDVVREQQARETLLREEQVRQARARAEQEEALRAEQRREERAMAADKPPEGGWRKWF